MQGAPAGERAGEDSSGEARGSQCASGQGEAGLVSSVGKTALEKRGGATVLAVRGRLARLRAQPLQRPWGRRDSYHPNGLCPHVHQIPSVGPYLAHLSFGSSTGQWASWKWSSRFPTLEKGHSHTAFVCAFPEGWFPNPSPLIVYVTLGGKAAML